jgi:prepilin-type N-terminal cleavage/methylation domain-containing protein
MKQVCGFSLVELMVASALLGGAVIFGMKFIGQTRDNEGRIKYRHQLQEVVKKNVFRLKATPSSDYPDQGTCKLREYSLKGEFLDDREFPSGDDSCSLFKPSRDGIFLVIDYRHYKDITATFDKPEFLKLPRHFPALFQIDITGYYSRKKSWFSRVVTLIRK